ncbi:7276_t:CDS:2, partial [Gigaspora rosea]
KWKRGPIVYYDNDIQEWNRAGMTDIVLKSINGLNDTNNIPDKFFEEINEKITPKIIVNLIKRCWSEKPSDRPTANELLDELFFYRQRDHEIWSEIESIEENMNFDIPPEKASLDYKPLASYTSQLITVSQEITSQVSQEI